MRRRSLAFAFLCLIALAVSSFGAGLSAQDATPIAATPVAASPVAATSQASSPGITLAAGGLNNPRGFTWGPDGSLYVALAGSGITSMGHVDNPTEYQFGPFFGENTASVARIDVRLDEAPIGCPVAVAGGLPSTRGMGGHEQGPADVAFLGGQMYVLQDGGDDAATLAPDQPNGIYRVNPDGTVTSILNMLEWTKNNPVAHLPYDQGPESETFAMMAGEGFIWLLEANSGQVLKVTTDGQATRIADLSEGHLVPTGLAASPDGGVYIGFLTSAPYPNSGSKVIKVMPDGTVSDVWTGLTAITALAVGKDDTLYALEMSTGNIDSPPFTTPNSGRIVRQTGPSSLAEVVVGLDYPIAMEMGPDNALYVAFPAFGSDPAIGGIVRIDLRYSQPMTVSNDILALDICETTTPTASAPADDMGGMSTPTASPMTGDATPTIDPPAQPADDPGKSQTGSQAVVIKNFAFDQASVTIPAGTVITWTNLDSTAHTVTSADGSFNSGNLNPGQSFSFQFEKPGTYTYNCSYHPNMQGTIIVT